MEEMNKKDAFCAGLHLTKLFPCAKGQLPAWEMLYDFPAMKTGPLRGPPVLAVTDTVTLSLPVPLAGDKVTQGWLLLDVIHEQFESEGVTVTDLLPLSLVKLPLKGEKL